MKLINQLKKSVEEYREYIVKEDAFNRSILDGTADPEALRQFLVDVHYLITHTPIHLRLAIQVSAGEPALHKYFKEKFIEEQGHDQWALDDLAKLSTRVKAPNRPPQVTEAMHIFVLHIEALIRKDPYLYLPYIFFAEYLVVIYGPEMTHGIEVKCGHGRDSLTVIDNHAELDKDHVHEWEEVIETIVDHDRYEDSYRVVMSETIRLHKLFFKACKNNKKGKGKARDEAA